MKICISTLDGIPILVYSKAIPKAEKAFKASFKGTGLKAPDIFNVELVAENTPATKDQEREALEKIKAILDTLGLDSYVGTAIYRFPGGDSVVFDDEIRASLPAEEGENHGTV